MWHCRGTAFLCVEPLRPMFVRVCTEMKVWVEKSHCDQNNLRGWEHLDEERCFYFILRGSFLVTVVACGTLCCQNQPLVRIFWPNPWLSHWESAMYVQGVRQECVHCIICLLALFVLCFVKPVFKTELCDSKVLHSLLWRACEMLMSWIN